ncbi:5-(carboxyamino)imidazole ribonucleotide synthase [soil metagenome]
MKIGILGAGQLGRMLAEAGRALDMEFRFLDPATEISARGAGEHVVAAYEDIDALEEFARGLDAITYEFENVPLESVRWLNQRVPVFPPPDALRSAQDRLFEKNFFTRCEIPTPPYRDFFFRDEYDDALRTLGLPAVMKTRRFGYDGKGQRVLRSQPVVELAWKDLNGIPLFLEGFVPFDREVSLIAVRARDGEFAFYPLIENHHREGILRLSIAPAAVSSFQQVIAEGYARKIMEELNYVGVLTIEFFVSGDKLLANEMAPRVHNSGHWTIEGAETSQFENHLRAVSGLPLGSTAPRGRSAMINLIGTIPDAARALDGAHFHDYEKSPRAGRKLAHLTLSAESWAQLSGQLAAAAKALQDPLLDDALRQVQSHELPPPDPPRNSS